MSRYDVTEDPLCYPGTNVLKNKADLTDQDELDQFEQLMFLTRSEEPLPEGALDYTGVNVQPIFDPRLHAKVLAWDNDNLVISSQNWLSADPPPDKPLSEIGLFIHSKNVGSYFKERFQMSLRS